MASSGLTVNSVVITVIAVAIGIVMVGSLLAPISADVMVDLNKLGGDGGTWANLVSVTVVMVILGLVVMAINSYTKR